MSNVEDVRFKESKPWWQLGEWTAADRKARAIIEDDWVINKVCIETDSRNNLVIKLTGFKWIFEYWEREEGRKENMLIFTHLIILEEILSKKILP